MGIQEEDEPPSTVGSEKGTTAANSIATSLIDSETFLKPDHTDLQGLYRCLATAHIKCSECLGSVGMCGMCACAESEIPASSAQNPIISTGFEKPNKLGSSEMRRLYSLAVSMQSHVDHPGKHETLERT